MLLEKNKPVQLWSRQISFKPVNITTGSPTYYVRLNGWVFQQASVQTDLVTTLRVTPGMDFMCNSDVILLDNKL